MQQLIDDIQNYVPTCEQEQADQRLFLEALETDPHCLTRASQAHFTVSAWTVDPTFTKTLMVYHDIYDSWSWIGGHADGYANLARVALRELEEETGAKGMLFKFKEPSVSKASINTEARRSPLLSLELLTVNGHMKRGTYVSSHLHLNVSYLVVADPAAQIRTAPEENSAVGWFDLEDAYAASTEPWIRDHVYRKLIDRTRTLADVLSISKERPYRLFDHNV